MCSTDQLLRQSKIFANAQSTSQDNENSLAEDGGDQLANSLLSQDDDESDLAREIQNKTGDLENQDNEDSLKIEQDEELT